MKMGAIKHTKRDNLKFRSNLILKEEEKEILRQVEILKQQYEEMKEKIEENEKK
jgi:hypothetical protein